LGDAIGQKTIHRIAAKVSLKKINRQNSLNPTPGLPDGLFSNRKSQFGLILEGFRLDWKILWPFGISYIDSGYFMTIGYILYSFGTFFPVLVSCTKKNLATLCRRYGKKAKKRLFPTENYSAYSSKKERKRRRERRE
jgi:hypothetical protein